MSNKRVYTSILAVILLIFLSTNVVAQEQDDKEEENANGLKAYSEVITEDAKSDSGLFTIHDVKGDFYFEVPDSLLRRDMLIVSRRAAMSSSNMENMVAGERPKNPLMVRWTKGPNGKTIYLQKVTSGNLLRFAGQDSSFKQSVERQTLDPILVAFEAKAIGPDSNSTVIPAAPLVLNDIKDLSPFSSGGLLEALGIVPPKKYSFKKERSYISDTKSFEKNIELRSMLTFTEGADQDIYSILMHRSMVLLPKEPMQPRIADNRIGHFSVGFNEYDGDKPVSLNHYLKRWKLEIPESKLGDFEEGEAVNPKEKIVFYIDRSTPEKWVEYIKKGVEDWKPAFEQAGFKNAIVAKEAPSDAEYDPENVNYSVIRYAASDIPNAMGPSVMDPRSGEILESDIIIYHNVLKLLRDWRFSQTAANDPSVRVPEMSDKVIGDALRFVVAHEVGHSLGLRHNMGASYAFPVDSLRSASFTQKYGTTPSIMDYARFNYVAQPEDKGVKVTPPRLGVYDKYAIEWAYKPILEADNAYEEQETLDSWIEEHDDNPWYYFGEGDLSSQDPTSQRESLGNDIVKASRYGVDNIKYTISHLDDWLMEEGEKYDNIENLYMATLDQYKRYLSHAGSVIAGVYIRNPRQGDDEPMYRYVEKEKQQKAVGFLLNQYRELPSWLENESLDSKLNIVNEEAGGLVRRIVSPSAYIERLYYSSLRSHLINDGKLMFLLDSEVSNPGEDVYTVEDFFSDIRKDVFKETREGEDLGYYRRLFQNVYVNWLLDKSHLEQTVAPQKAINWKIDQKDAGFCSVDHLHELSKLQEVKDLNSDVIQQYAQNNNLYFQILDLERRDKKAIIESMTLAEVRKVKEIVEEAAKDNDGVLGAHYNYLFRRINVFLNAGT